MEPLCDRLVVAAPPGLELPPSRVARVDDLPGCEGPLSGLVAGLGTLPFGRAIVLGVDFPLLRPAMLAYLLERLAAEGAVAVVPAPGGVWQPLAAVYDPRAVPALAGRLAAGERSVTAAVGTLAPLVVADRDLERVEGGVESFFNVNTPRDLAEAELRIRSGTTPERAGPEPAR
jgi:molybdopterin-guanine dinucleotide biosynthesis protein A